MSNNPNNKNAANKCIEGGIDGAVVGPIPPTDDVGATQRFRNMYCNPRIPYQADLAMDVNLYGGDGGGGGGKR